MFDNNHQVTFDGARYTCPACTFSAVLTTDDRIIQTDPGQPGHDHLAQAWAMRRADDARAAWAEQAMQRLRQHYADKTPLPEADDNRDDLVAAGVIDPRPLDRRLLQRLYRCVITEHGL